MTISTTSANPAGNVEHIPLDTLSSSSAANERGEMPAVKAAPSNLSPKALGKQPATTRANTATGPISPFNIREMVPAEVQQRVSPWNVPRQIYNHFLPPAPRNVQELLGAYETAIQTVRASRPVNPTAYKAFQAKRQAALDLEFRAAIQTQQAELLEKASSLLTTLKGQAGNLPANVASLFENVENISRGDIQEKAAQIKQEAAKSWGDVGTAWDSALVDYLDAHQLDRQELEAGFARAGSPAYASRVAAPVVLSAAMAIPSFIHPDKVAQRFALSLGNAAIGLGVGAVLHPLTYAMTTLASVTWADRLFNHASDIQDLLGTKMIDEVGRDLQTALQQAGEALEAWNGVKNGSDTQAKSTVLANLKHAEKNLKAAEHEYLMRADLNRIYIQGFQNQGIANGLKFYANSSVGVVSALLGSQWGASIQLGAAATHFAAHMAISGDDEKNKQLRMFYLRMRASVPESEASEAPTEAELTRFSNEIRDPFKVAQGALQQIFSARVRTLDTEIAGTLGIQPNEWRKVLAHRADLESGGEEANLSQEDRTLATGLEAQIARLMDSFSPAKREALQQKVALRNNTAQDIEHVGSGQFSKVSGSNQEEVYLGLQITPPASGPLEQLKNLFGPLSPEFRIGMQQGWARIKLPQEVMTTYGLAYWAAFQLGVCGENGPLILSKFAQAMMAAATYAKDNKSPSQQQTIILQSALTFINLAVTATLMIAAKRLLDMVVHPKGMREKINPLAGGRSSVGNTVYLAALLRDRVPHRAEAAKTDADAGFQRAGLVTSDHAAELPKTIGKRMAVLAEESIPAGGIRDNFFEGAELLNQLQNAIRGAESEARIEELPADSTFDPESQATRGAGPSSRPAGS